MESKSARMRQLFAQGKSVSEVAKLVGVDYQFAYGVAKRAGFIQAGATVPREQLQSDGAHPGDVDIEANVRTYLEDRRPTDRYASFDYCFNYFQARREEGRIADLADGVELQVACLQLGFYLASWGMYRGSTILLQRSLAHLAPVIDVIARAPVDAWDIDADGYTRDACKSLLEVGAQIRAAFPEGATDTLVTKIMLGVFGSVPAFDTNFKTGFGVYAFGENALMRVGRFYRESAEAIERHRVPTLDFDTGVASNRRYTRAKVIDMIFFVEGAPRG